MTTTELLIQAIAAIGVSLVSVWFISGEYRAWKAHRKWAREAKELAERVKGGMKA